MKIVFATWLVDKSLGDSLTKNSAANRLVSYHFIVEQKVTKKILKNYIKKGVHS
jgi:hypothetical protein